MPRDASGNYTLPAGNPVVTGTTIDSSWANDTMDDIKDVLTDSLSRSGDGGMLVAMEFASGVVGAPGITWTSEPTSGFYLAAANDMRVSIAGSDRARFRADASNPFQIWNGATWGNVLNAGQDVTITADWVFSGLLTVPEATVTAHEAALTIIEGQITGADFTEWDTAYGWGDHAGLYETADAAIVKSDEAETISASWTFTGIPILDAPVAVADFGTGGKVKDGGDTLRPIGFNVMPVYEIDVADTVDLAHNGMYWHKDSGAAVAITLDEDADIPQGATIVLANEDDSDITITEGAGVTIKWFDGGGSAPTEGNLTLTQAGVATIYKYSDTVYHVWGNGLS